MKQPLQAIPLPAPKETAQRRTRSVRPPALAQLVADSARMALQRKLGEAANRAGAPKSTPHGPGGNAHQQLVLLNAALAAEEEEKKSR